MTPTPATRLIPLALSFFASAPLSPAILATAAGLTMPVMAAQLQPDQAAAKLPIRNITLYRSGVGYFQRRGLVDSGDRIQLRFATDQINDLLKSMVILDPQQALQTVSYGSKEPLARRLASFGINIADNPPAGEILNRLRGNKVAITTDDGAVAGTILNVETRPTVLAGKPGDPQTVANLPWINLVTASGVKSVNLTRASGFELLDKSLQEELNKALAAIAEHSADRIKTVDLTFGGQGGREVAVAYVNEMPIWKTSYRLVLPTQPEGRADPADQGGQPTIQGWAIVENTTDEDWENVRLGLVAGRPVSFQMDLYEPLHIPRPEVPVPTVPGASPRVYQEGSSFADARRLGEVAAAKAPGTPPARDLPQIELGRALRQRAAGGGGEQSPFREEADKYGLSAEDMLNYSAIAAASAGEVGEVFEYQLKEPVSIARQHSAMLPILSSAIEGRRVSIYSSADGLGHPMRGVELKNTTGLQLMPGPISVFDGAAYAGDAQIGHITSNDKRLLAYAVDLDVSALTKEDNTSTVRKLRIVNGLLEQTSKQVHKVAYAFNNKDQKRPRAVLIEHPRMPGWELVEPARPAEETQTLRRFELSLAPGESGKIDVVHERTDHQHFALVNFDFNTLQAYARDGKVSKAVIDAFTRAGQLQAAINDTQRKIAQLDQERTAINEDQSRIRQNIGSVSRDTDLYRRYTAKLNEQETRLETIREEREKLQAQSNQQQRELDAFLRTLNVE